MPFVQVLCDDQSTLDALIACGFNDEVRNVVSVATNCTDPGGAVSEGGVDVRYIVRLPEDDTDWPVVVLVDARRLPTREAEYEVRATTLGQELARIVPQGLQVASRIRLSDEVWTVSAGTAVP